MSDPQQVAGTHEVAGGPLFVGSRFARSPGGDLRSGRMRQMVPVFAVGASYFGVAWLGLLGTRAGTHVAVLWPASGFLVGLLLLVELQSWPWVLVAALAGGLTAELVLGRGLEVACGLSVADCAEAWLAAFAVWRLAGHRFRLDLLRSVILLAVAGLTAVGVTALFGAEVVVLGLGGTYWNTWLLLWLAHSVGILVITPAVLVLAEAASGGIHPTSRHVIEGVLMLAGLAAVCVAVFTRPAGASRSVLGFVLPVFPFLLWCAVRCGSCGAPFLALVLWAAAGAGTLSGHGPFTDSASSYGAHLVQVEWFLALATLWLLVGGARADELRERQLSLARSNLQLRREGELLRKAEARFRDLLEAAPEAIVIVNQTGTMLLVNEQAEELFGYPREELIGEQVELLVPERCRARHVALRDAFLAAPMTRAMGRGADLLVVRKDGRELPVEITVGVLETDAGVLVSAAVRDISERKRFESQLQHLADHDDLTGLVNRRRFDEELKREIARTRRYGSVGSVLAIDIDHFKYVNDSLGHSAGDALIAAVAETLQTRLRETDVIARIGGDEFAVILPGVDEHGARLVASDLLDAVRRGIRVDLPRTLRQITASIGVAPFARVADLTSEKLLGAADIAMYDAKEGGRDGVAVYSSAEGREGQMTTRLTWADRIRRALEEDSFVLHAQPILSLTGNHTPRHELLLRMVGDSGELILPSAFLNVAERMDLIQEIDRWVLRETSRLLGREQRAGHNIVLEVNVSAKSIGDPALADVIAQALEAGGADGSGLCLEVTETAAIVNIERAKRFAAKVAAIGCAVALDDFGAGFASFYYLKHLPIDYLKIDGEFIQGICESRTDQLVVKSLVEIAHGLGKCTIAEFVADAETLELLRQFQIDYAQGFFIADSKPVAEVDLAAQGWAGSRLDRHTAR